MQFEALIQAFAAAQPRFAKTDSFRVFHGRGRCFPGLDFLSIDFFAPTLLVTIYRSPPEGFVAALSEYIQNTIFSAQVSCLLVQRRDLKEYAVEVLAGTMPADFRAVRKNLGFQLLSEQQNVGYFLDIEPARTWIEANVKDKAVLNLFAFTCSFSVVAMAAGARSVVNIDMNRKVLNIGRINHEHNGIATEHIAFFAHDILRSWGKLIRKGPYDLAVVDPPSMQRGSFVAAKDYPKIIGKLPALLCEGGRALLCLNAPEISCAEFKDLITSCGPPLVLEEVLAANPDFGDRGENSLKMLVYRLETGFSMPPL